VVQPCLHAEENSRKTNAKISLQRAEFDKNMQKRLQKISNSIEELKKKVASEPEAVQKDLNVYLGNAEEQKKEAEDELAGLKKATISEWKKMSVAVDSAAVNIEKTLEKAKMRLESGN
jgi:hypothetical protein